MTTEDPATISARNGHSRCLLCGNLNPRSLNLSFQAAEDGGVRTRFKADTELQGYDDILHGGVIASLLDAAMTHCLFHHGVQAVTGDLHVRFVQRARSVDAGPIPGETSFEDTGGPFYLDPEGERADPIDDDLALWIRTDDGVIG